MRKHTDIVGHVYGIDSIETGRNPQNTDITHMQVVTDGSRIRLVAFNDDEAREIIQQMRDALDEWEALLPVEVQAEAVGV
jgi:hypothetical protein